jgi:dynein heavy chain
MEPDEGLEKVADALKICCLFRDTFFVKKAGLQPYFKDKPIVEWEFQSSLIFSRMDRFVDQLRLIEVRGLASPRHLEQGRN